MSYKILAIIQSRSDSIRLPKKNILKFNNLTTIEHVYKRLLKSKYINDIIVATTNASSDDKFVNFLKNKKIKFYRGSKNNVYQRFLKAAKNLKCDIVVRITGDCPLIDPIIVDLVIKNLLNSNAQYSSNVCPPTYANGFSVEAFYLDLLIKENKNVNTKYDREHVTTYFRKSKNIKKINLINKVDDSNIRLTLDDYFDYNNIKYIFEKFKKKNFFTYKDILSFVKSKKNKVNMIKPRNDFEDLSKDQKLLIRAKSIIPDGNMLISKRKVELMDKKIKKYLKIIDQIENTRTKNNINWMDLMRVAFKNSPEESKKIVKKINLSDQKINKLLQKLIK